MEIFHRHILSPNKPNKAEQILPNLRTQVLVLCTISKYKTQGKINQMTVQFYTLMQKSPDVITRITKVPERKLTVCLTEAMVIGYGIYFV